MVSGSPQDIETGVSQKLEDEKTIVQVDSSSTTHNSTNNTSGESTAPDDPNIVFWDGPDDPES